MTNLFYKAIDDLQSGGIIMLLLYIISIYLWTNMLKKYWFLKKQQSEKVDKILCFKDFNSFSELCEESLFLNIFKSLKQTPSNQKINKFYELSIFAASLFNKDLKIINTLIIIAPLLGLLGTVNGMIKTFETLNYYNAETLAFSDGIKQALYTTELGLVISIPAFFFFNRLKRKVEKLTQQINKLELLIKEN